MPDRDRDDRADLEDVEVRLTGWGIADRHETLNSLHWGPDGWLYGCQGFATRSRVGKPADAKFRYEKGAKFPRDIKYDGPITELNGGVWRYHPTKRRFEVVAHGFSNPWGIDYDAKGQLFITACVIPHLWHVVPGGIYHRQGGRHYNPYVYSDIQTIADHRHRSAHGGARVYLSDAFADHYRGQIFMANIHEHAVLVDELEPRGSGFVGRHGEDFLMANNAQWIGFSIEIGPDGAVYVLDWHDADICGNDVLNGETGRVFRIAPTTSQADSFEGRYSDLGRMSDAELVDLQLNRSAWHARRARVILQGRATDGAIDAAARTTLRTIFRTHANPDYRLRAMWALHVTGEIADDELLATLDRPDEHVRAWAIQLLCEDSAPTRAALDRFVELAGHDPSPVVRLYLAAAIQRMRFESRWDLAAELVRREEDADDHNIPKMIWFGIEPIVPRDPTRALELASSSRIPMVTRHIARRLAEDEKLEELVQAIETQSQLRESLLRGMLDTLTGSYDAVPPPSWERVYELLKSDGGEIGQLALELAQQFGSVQAASEMLATLENERADVELRRKAMRGLARRKHPQLKKLLNDLLNDSRLRRDAIQSMASYEDTRLARNLLAGYADFGAEEKLDAVHTLASRQSYGRLLTAAIEAGDVPRRDIPAYVARLMRRVVGTRFGDVWGPTDELSTDQAAQIAHYRELLNTDVLAAASTERGQEVFRRTCKACHTLHDEGGKIGPDITGANRTNLEYLLGNIVTPSAVIQDAYRMHLVVTEDGQVFSGILAGDDARQVRLRVAGQDEPVIVPKSVIELQEIAPVSMMPEGMLKDLTDSEIADLFAYLMFSS